MNNKHLILILKQYNIDFTGKFDERGNKAMIFIIQEATETILYLSQETVRVL